MTEEYRPFPDLVGWVPSVDLSSADGAFARLAEARVAVSPDDLERALTVATRYAAVDTGALEGLYATTRGFTRTIAEQTATWEAALGQHPAAMREAIADQLSGYEMVLDAATRSVPITAVWMRQLHEVICRSEESHRVLTPLGWQDQPLHKGKYKTQPNNPTSAETGRVHHYAPPSDVPGEMSRLVDTLSSEAFANSHPVIQAAYAHYAFVSIHPFADGNGRVARALASAFLYRNPGVPLVIFADQRNAYLDSLEAADTGDATDFVRFVRDRAAETADLVLFTLETKGSPPSLSEEVAAIRSRDRTGIDGQERIAAVVIDEAGDWAGAQIRDPSVTPDVVGAISLPHGRGTNVGLGYTFEIPPSRIRVRTTVTIRWDGERFTVSAMPVADHNVPVPRVPATRDLSLSIPDVVPLVSTSAQLRIRAWIGLVMTGLLEGLAHQLQDESEGP